MVMKTGLGLYRKHRLLFAYLNLVLFWLKKTLFDFDYANQFIQRVDKVSIKLLLKKNGAKIGENCDIETGLVFHNCQNYSNLIIGDNCHIGKNCFFDLKSKIVISNNVTISMNVSIITHIDVGKSNLARIFPASDKATILEDDVYIGANSIILMGIGIGKSSFVGAGSIVTKTIPGNTLAYGNPARSIKNIKIQ